MPFRRLRLTTRLLVYYLASLAAVLIAFDVVLYSVLRAQQYHQLDSRLESALAALAAAAEFDEQGLEWEPQNRSIGVGRDRGPDQVRWTIHNRAGGIVDRSENFGDAPPWSMAERTLPPGSGSIGEINWQGNPWRAEVRVLSAAGSAEAAERLSAASDEDSERYTSLTLTSALPLAPLTASLRSLVGILAGVSVAVWLAVAVSGWALCRRALAPLVAMAAGAERISATTAGARIAVPETADEVALLGHAFNALLGRFQESFEKQRRFTSDASHQLRTPLAVMLGQIDVVLRRDREGEEYRRVIQILRRRVVELRQMTEMLLLLARAESDRQIIECDRVDVGDLLAEIVARRGETTGARQITVEIAEGAPLEVRVQAFLFTQVLDNLLDNAERYSPPEAPVEIAARRRGQHIELTVADQGPGIPADEATHVFEPFYRGRAGRQSESAGSGLGLSVARRIVEAFGGTLELAGATDTGAKFVISLPAASEHGQPREAIESLPAQACANDGFT
jgi:two-component system, OmpR family, sensor kinase